jgi:hypothetical protein
VTVLDDTVSVAARLAAAACASSPARPGAWRDPRARSLRSTGWNATRYLSFPAQSVSAVLKPAGLDKSKGLISAAFVIDVNDPRFSDDPGLKQWKEPCLSG